MAVKLLPNRDLGQVNTLKSPQQGFGRRTVGGSFRIAGIQPCHRGFAVSQTLASTELKPRQDPQANRQQAHEAGRSLVTLHIHGRQRQRFALQPSQPTLHQVFFAVRQDGLLKGQHFWDLIGRIHAPAKPAHGFCLRMAWAACCSDATSL